MQAVEDIVCAIFGCGDSSSGPILYTQEQNELRLGLNWPFIGVSAEEVAGGPRISAVQAYTSAPKGPRPNSSAQPSQDFDEGIYEDCVEENLRTGPGSVIGPVCVGGSKGGLLTGNPAVSITSSAFCLAGIAVKAICTASVMSRK